MKAENPTNFKMVSTFTLDTSLTNVYRRIEFYILVRREEGKRREPEESRFFMVKDFVCGFGR